MLFLVKLLFGLIMVAGVVVMVVGVLVEHSVALALVGGFVALIGVWGFNWLGE